LKRADADVYYQRACGSMVGVITLLCKLLNHPYVCSTSSDMDVNGSKERGMNIIKRSVFKYGMKHADRILVQTEAQNANLLKRFGRGGVLIRNTYALPENGLDLERRFIIWVASFRDLKRPELFLEIAARVREQEFLMVGGPYQHHLELYDIIKEKAQAVPNLKLTGMVHPDEVGRYFDQAKLLVCTSTVEGFPNTFLQAWSRGVPVISTVDPDSLIARLDLGRFCSSVDELVEAVSMLSSDDDLCREIGERAREYVTENHHPAAVSARYRELLDELLASKVSGQNS
jgi:glycosyltransferase involved in cell wall biosynthesis